MNLAGKVALVTGGETGIGFEYVKELFRNGVQKICIAGLDKTKAENAIKMLNVEFGTDVEVIFIKTDVCKENEMEAAFSHVISTWKQLDIVINNSGIMDDFNWNLEISVNVNGVVKGSMLAMKYMSKENGGKGGVIVNVASILGLQSMASIPVYVGTKHAVLGYSRSLGMKYNFDKSGVSVLTMCPGVTITPLITEAHKHTSAKDLGTEVRRELDTLPSQKPENVAKGLIHMLKNGKTGSVWVCEGGEPIYEVEIPDRLTLRKK